MSVSAIAFVAIFFSGVLLAVFRHPVFGLYTYVLVFYLHPPARWWAADLPDLRWSLVAAIVTLIAAVRLGHSAHRPSWIANQPGRLLVVCTLWIWIQMAWAMNPEPHFEAAVLFTKYVVLFYVIYRLVETEADMRNFLLVHVLGCFYLGWVAYGSPAAESGRLEGVGGPGIDEANALSMQLATGVFAAAMLLLTIRHWAKWSLLLPLAFMLNTIVLCSSRSSFLALLAGGLVIAVFKPRAHRKIFYAYTALGLVLFAMLASQFFWERMGTIQAGIENREEMDGSAESRLYLADAQFRIFLGHPLGVGHRGTELLTPLYSEEEFQRGRAGRASHNTFLTMLTEQGLVGALVYLMIFAWALKSLSLLRSQYATFTAADQGHIATLAASLTCVFLAGQFVDYFKSEIQIWLLALLAARVSLVLANQRRVATTGLVARMEPPSQSKSDAPAQRANATR